MKKRVLAAVLWFYVTWYAWSMVAFIFAISDAPGPVIGLAAAVLFAGDPFGRIWTSREATLAETPTAPGATPAPPATAEPV